MWQRRDSLSLSLSVSASETRKLTQVSVSPVSAKWTLVLSNLVSYHARYHALTQDFIQLSFYKRLFNYKIELSLLNVFNILCNSCILSIKFARAINVSLLIVNSFILFGLTFFVTSTYPQLQVSGLCSSFSINCGYVF